MRYITALQAEAETLPNFLNGDIRGEVLACTGDVVQVGGMAGIATLGDLLQIEEEQGRYVTAEITALTESTTTAMAYGALDCVRLGARVFYKGQPPLSISDDWIGKVLDPLGQRADGTKPAGGAGTLTLVRPPPPAAQRQAMGPRLNTGVAAFDTFLPLCQGQRLGLFAGSGVGKSSLLASLAKGVEADVVILALIGERGHEVNGFVNNTLGAAGMERAVVIAATSSDPAPMKKRAAFLAMATAEYFRDQGKHVLLLFDSITRFAEAHREVALSSGETPSLRAFPPSTFRAVASLAERAGPGTAQTGHITAVFSVLVAGSNMDEPVADMVRGILDGHVTLSRDIAERGRYPAIDVRRSVSRSLPDAASVVENTLLADARNLIALYEDAAAMIRAGLHSPGSDPALDRAIQIWPVLDRFIGEAAPGTAEDSFHRLTMILTPQETAPTETVPTAPQTEA